MKNSVSYDDKNEVLKIDIDKAEIIAARKYFLQNKKDALNIEVNFKEQIFGVKFKVVLFSEGE